MKLSLKSSYFLASSLQVISTLLPQESTSALQPHLRPPGRSVYLIIVGQELVLNIFDLDINPENETKNLIHDLLFEVDDDEHKAEGSNSNHRTFKTYEKEHQEQIKSKIHTNFYNICP